MVEEPPFPRHFTLPGPWWGRAEVSEPGAACTYIPRFVHLGFPFLDCVIYCFIPKHLPSGSGEISEVKSTFAALAEDPCSVPSIHTVAQLFVTPAPGNHTFFWSP